MYKIYMDLAIMTSPRPIHAISDNGRPVIAHIPELVSHLRSKLMTSEDALVHLPHGMLGFFIGYATKQGLVRRIFYRECHWCICNAGVAFLFQPDW